MKITKKAIDTYIRNRLATDNIWAKRALVLLYQNQTDKEKDWEQPLVRNDMGFTIQDAGFLTSVAKQLEAKGSLTEKQMEYVRKLVSKYSRQIAILSNQGLLLKLVEKNMSTVSNQ